MTRDRVRRILALAAPHWVVAVLLIAGFAVVAGAFDGGRAAWWGGLVAIVLAVAIALDARDRLAGRRSTHPFFAVEGPLLWVVGLYAAVRAVGPYGPHLTPLMAALVGWLWATFPRPVAVRALVAAGLLELGLTLAGRQEFPFLLLHGLIYGGVAWGLTRFAHSEAFRKQVEKTQARAEAEARKDDRRREFGLSTDQAPVLTALPAAAAVGERPTVGSFALDHLDRAFTLEVEILQQALGLLGAVVLWHDPQASQLRLRAHAGEGPWSTAPFAEGTGVPGSVLRDAAEVAVAPLLPGGGVLPYRSGDTSAVGAALAVAIPGEGKPLGVLCVDRARTDRFSEVERAVVRAAARKIGFDVEVGQRLKQVDTEYSAIERICVGLQALNSALSMAESAAAALAAISTLVRPDLAVLSLVQGNLHRVVRAEGLGADVLADLQFAADEGLVGRAVTLARPLPVGGIWRGQQGVFVAKDHLEGMHSLLVIPLLHLVKGEGTPIGALTVAARREGAFSARPQQMLELIANQVAVKLDLARAHEQIREQASIDGLTGLANHRVFQQAFDNMLVRATRQKSPLCMVLLDIDHFKQLNDTCGHPFGDGVLRSVAQVLGAAVRKVDLAARYGGEEFALLLEGSDLEGGRRLAERIRAEVESLSFEHRAAEGDAPRVVRVSLSAGIAVFPADGGTKAELIDRADKALYQAKERGRNRAVAWADLVPPTA